MNPQTTDVEVIKIDEQRFARDEPKNRQGGTNAQQHISSAAQVQRKAKLQTDAVNSGK